MPLIVIAMGLLTAANRWLGKSLLYPPALFALVWTVSLLLLSISGSLFYHVGIDTLLWYLWGACAFSTGGAVAWLVSSTFASHPRRGPANASSHRQRAIDRLLNWLLLVLVLVFPIYIYWMIQLAAESSKESFLWAVQLQLRGYKADEGASHVSILDNFAVFSILVAIVCQKESDGTWQRRLRTGAAVLLALGYNLVRGERTAAVMLLISLVGISWLRAGRIKWKQLALMATLFIFVFSFIGITLQKGYVSNEASLSENFQPLVESFQLYAVGSIVAFDDVFHHPGRIPPVWKWNRVFLQAANKLGANYYVPSLNAEYVDVGPEMFMNTYTMYFAYFPDFGLLGTSLIITLLGSAVTFAYLAADRGDPQAQVLFSILLSGILLSGSSEQFLLALNFLAKALLFTFVVYGWRGLEGFLGLGRTPVAKNMGELVKEHWSR